MDNWKKTSLLTTISVLVILTVALHLFSGTVSFPSSKIEFSSWQPREVRVPFKGEKPENIILFIADGMGFGHLSLALLTQQSDQSTSVWDDFDVKGWHDARSAYGPLTDSEASATAMATGKSTNFGHIGIDIEQNRLKNIFEVASEKQYLTAIVTDSYIWDGTPAAFSAHIRNEDDARTILNQMTESSLDLLFGELEDVGEDDVPEKEETLSILSNRFQLLDNSLDFTNVNLSSQPIAAIFEEDQVQDLNSTPNLTQLVATALQFLSAQDQPFLLLVECEEMDAASHENDSKRVLNGLKSIQKTLADVLEFSKSDGKTLVLFTADHETGGLSALADFDDYPDLQMRWNTLDHTAAVVPLFADGPGSDYFANVNRNWEIGDRLMNLIYKDSIAQIIEQ